ncbi:MAG: hypothetical protein ABFC56_08230 [Clostridiaceae bacterium]|nr:ATP-binding protein [Eubacteriales bacterium]
MLEIIQSIVAPNNLAEDTKANLHEKFCSAILYLSCSDSIYAIFIEPNTETDSYSSKKIYMPKIQIYSRNATSPKFIKCSSKNGFAPAIKEFLAAGYQQRRLYEYSVNPNRIIEIVDGFLRWKDPIEYDKLVNQLAYFEEQLRGILFDSEKARSESGKSFIDYIQDEDLVVKISGILTQINTKRNALRDKRAEMISNLNSVLRGKVKLALASKLSNSNWRNEISHLADRVCPIYKASYESHLCVIRTLEKVYGISETSHSFDFFLMLLDRQFQAIIDAYKLSATIQDLENIRCQIQERHIEIFVEDGLRMEYNINSGTVHSERFEDNSKLSMGQNAVALLLIILNAGDALGDSRPLLMDQPEDDLDNSYIYNTLVQAFRKAKTKRQVIISTHNANIPVICDAENISVLRFNGQYGYLNNVGAIDSCTISRDVLDIMEGGAEAIRRRIEKYKNLPGHIG